MKHFLIFLFLINNLFLSAQDTSSITFKGKVVDSSNYQVIPGARVSLILSQDTLISLTNQFGEFTFRNLIPDTIYDVEIKKQHFLFNSFLPTFNLNARNEIKMEYSIVPLVECNETNLPELLFMRNSHDINPQDKGKLSSLIDILKDNKSLTIDIIGYRYVDENHPVSGKRVQSVQEFFSLNGIDSSRINTVNKKDEPRTIYPDCIYTGIPTDAQAEVLSEEYINMISSEKEREKAKQKQRAVIFRFNKHEEDQR